jgi:hypothetical protein
VLNVLDDHSRRMKLDFCVQNSNFPRSGHVLGADSVFAVQKSNQIAKEPMQLRAKVHVVGNLTYQNCVEIQSKHLATGDSVA